MGIGAASTRTGGPAAWPRGTGRAPHTFDGRRRGFRLLSLGRRVARGLLDQGGDRRPQRGIGRQYPVIPMPVPSRGRHQGCQSLDELQRREQQLGFAVRLRLGQTIQQPVCIQCLHALQGEDRTGTIPEQPFQPPAVVGLDPHQASMENPPPLSYCVMSLASSRSR